MLNFVQEIIKNFIMLRFRIFLFILLFSVFNSIADELEYLNDSSYIGMYGDLEEITVQSNAVIQKVDKQVLLPTAEVKKASANGISLLKNMALPRIVVSSVDNSVTTLSGDGVQLRINGVLSTKEEVTALSPKDIIRIDYYDEPGVRFGNVASVIDYIVKKRETGGNVMLDAMNSVNLPGWGEYMFSGKIHSGKSSFSLLTSYAPRDVMWKRNNNEEYYFSSGKIENNEIGEPTRYKVDPINLALTYNWTNADKDLLQLSLRNNMTFKPHSHTDRNSKLVQEKDSFLITDYEQSNSISPSIDLYYQHKFANQHALYFNVVGTYINTDTKRQFTQAPLLGVLADTTSVMSNVKGNKYSLISEAIYEKQWEKIKLTAGAKYTHQWVENNYYIDEIVSPVSMTTAETYLFSELQHRVGKFAYTIGLGAMNTIIRQSGVNQSTWIARPQLTMSYDVGKGVFLRYNAYVSGYQPSLSSMNDITQPIDKYQVRRGNPNLKPVMYFSNDILLSYQSPYVSLDVTARYNYDHKPIMDESFEENGLIVRTQANQQAFHRVQVNASLQVRLLSNKLIFTVSPFLNYYVSEGNNYLHTHLNPGIRAGVLGIYKSWQFFGEVSTRRNNLWGETLTYGEFSHLLGIGYNDEKWSAKVMMVNPFSMNGYTNKIEDLSSVAPKTQVAEMPDFKQVLMLNFTMNLDFGKSREEAQKRLNNSDTDAGILLRQ